MDNKEHPFFESLSYETYQNISKQTLWGIIVFVSTLITLFSISLVILYRYNSIRSETRPLIDQKKRFETMESERKELAQKLSPFRIKNQKKACVAEKLTTINDLLRTLLAKPKPIEIISCRIKKKQLVLIIESAQSDYRTWEKKISESKLLKNVTTTHIKKAESGTIATVEAGIIF